MNDRKDNAVWVALLTLQRALSLLFIIGAFVFPAYIFFRHDLSVLPVYDRSGTVIWHANYFAISLGMGAFMLLLSSWSFMAAGKAMRQMKGAK